MLHSTEVFRANPEASYFGKYTIFYCPCRPYPSTSGPIRARQNSPTSTTCCIYIDMSHALDKEKTGMVNDHIWVRKQDVNALSQSPSQPAFDTFAAAAAAREAADFCSLLNALYFW